MAKRSEAKRTTILGGDNQRQRACDGRRVTQEDRTHDSHRVTHKDTIQTKRVTSRFGALSRVWTVHGPQQWVRGRPLSRPTLIPVTVTERHNRVTHRRGLSKFIAGTTFVITENGTVKIVTWQRRRHSYKDSGESVQSVGQK